MKLLNYRFIYFCLLLSQNSFGHSIPVPVLKHSESEQTHICATENQSTKCLQIKVEQLQKLLDKQQDQPRYELQLQTNELSNCSNGTTYTDPPWAEPTFKSLMICGAIFTGLGPLSQLVQNIMGCIYKKPPALKDTSWGFIDIMANALVTAGMFVQIYGMKVKIEVLDYASMAVVIVIEAGIITQTFGSWVYYKVRRKGYGSINS